MFTVNYQRGKGLECQEASASSICVNPQEQNRQPHQPLYRSQFASKVRIDKWVQKTGCHQTMGTARVPYTRPKFLRKHSRLPPVFFDPNDLKVDKSKTVNYGKEQRDVLPRKEITKGHTGILKKNQACRYPPPPTDMAFFRRNSDPTYEDLYTKHRRVQKVHAHCWDKSSEVDWQSSFGSQSNTNYNNNNNNNMNINEGTMTSNRRFHVDENGRIGGEGRVGYNGPPNVIERGRRDFLQENALKILRMPPKRSIRCYLNEKGVHQIDLSQGPFVLRPGFGQVPKYLEKRKQELYDEEIEMKRRMEAQQACRTISEMERLFIIQGLEEHWADLNREYLRLPTHSLTIRTTRLKSQLEEKFKELEDDLRLFKATDHLLVGAVNKSQYC